MNAQEVFDKALNDIRVQGCAAIDEYGRCLYTTQDGKHCAAYGFLNPEGQQVNLDGGGWAGVPNSLKTKDGIEHVELIFAVQRAHDSAAREAAGNNAEFMTLFESNMRRVAVTWNLVYKAA